MFKKIAIGLLLTTVLGAGGAAAAYQASNQEPEPVASAPEAITQGQGNSAAAQGQQGESQQGNSEMAAEGSLGEPWMETGIITAIEEAGFQFSLENGETVFIELGPPDYWQNQGVTLEVGQTVTVDGSNNEGMIHATAVQTADGQILQVRSETGMPLWSGGADNAQGQNGGADGEHTGMPQMDVEEWITIEGTLMSFNGGNMTMATADGDILSFKTGQPRFFAEQGITFQVGDEIVVVGFYQGAEFQTGDITQVSTGLRVMLRDPNGRPLWAGGGGGGGHGGGGK